MNKGTIILSVSKEATQAEIKAIRDKYKEDNKIVNIVISNENDCEEMLSNLLKARVNP